MQTDLAGLAMGIQHDQPLFYKDFEMIRVIVQHHLTSEGQAQFADWVADVKRRAVSYPGYIDVCQVRDIRHPERTIIQLEWDSEASLNNWRDSQDHADVINASATFRGKPMQAFFLEV